MKRSSKKILSIMMCGAVACMFTACADKTPEPVVSVALDKTSLVMEQWDESVINATVRGGSNTEWSVTGDAVSIKYEDNRCVLTAVKAGAAEIVAKSGKASATCSVRVAANDLAPVLIIDEFDSAAAELSLRAGDEFSLTPVVRYNGMDYDDFTVSYKSASDAVTVDENGKITAVKAGESAVKVTAEWRGYDAGSLTATINVNVCKNNVIVPDAYNAKLVYDGFASENSTTQTITADVYINGHKTDSSITWRADPQDGDVPQAVVCENGRFSPSGEIEGSCHYRAISTVDGQEISSGLVKISVSAVRGEVTALNSWLRFTAGTLKNVAGADYHALSELDLGVITIKAPDGDAIADAEITFGTTDPSVATVGSDGKVTATEMTGVEFGEKRECKITAKYNAAVYEIADVTVTEYSGATAITSVADINALSGTSDAREFDPNNSNKNTTGENGEYVVKSWDSQDAPKYFVLTADLDLTSRNGAFTKDLYGTLDGNGHTVKGCALYAQSASWWDANEPSRSGYTTLIKELYGTVKNIGFTDFKITKSAGSTLNCNMRSWFPLSIVAMLHAGGVMENIYVEITKWDVGGLASNATGGGLSYISNGALCAGMNTEHSENLPIVRKCIVEATFEHALQNHTGLIFGHCYGTQTDNYGIVHGIGVRDIPSINSGWGTAEYGADPYAYNYESWSALISAQPLSFGEGGIFATDFWTHTVKN